MRRRWIVRNKINKNGEKEFRGYFAKHFTDGSNHWVQSAGEAKVFYDGRLAKHYIKKYKLNNCEVLYEERI